MIAIGWTSAWRAALSSRRRGLLLGVVPAWLTIGIALVFMAAEGYHVALAAGTIARYAAGAAVTAGFLTAAPLGAPCVGESTLGSPSELGRMETVHSKRLG
jgi:hypothetical protein